MKKIPENALLVIKAITPLIVIIFLFFFLGNIGFDKVSYVMGQIAEAKEDRVMFAQKLELLRTVAITGIKDSNTVTSSLPDTDSALLAVHQLKNLAASSGLVLSSVKTNTDSAVMGEINNTTVNFKISGDRLPLNSFLSDIQTLAPIILLKSAKIIEQNGIYVGEIAVDSFWSPLPTQLPATIEEFQDLTEEDKKILTIVDGLTQPAFLNPPPVSGAGKENPFSL